MIYFIEYAGLIKVGYTSNVNNRLKDFRTTMPTLVLLGTMDGTRGHERTIHDCLVIYRKNREWFEDRPEVRDFLKSAMFEGVREWKNSRISGYKPTMWDERAKRLCEIICSDRPKSQLKQIEKEYSIPDGTLWEMRYRLQREVSVGEFFALLTAARETLTQRRLKLERSEAFVADLERQETKKAGEVLLAEARLVAAQRKSDAALVEIKAAVRQATHTHSVDPPK